MGFPCFGGVLRQGLLCDANVTSTSLVGCDDDQGDCDEHGDDDHHHGDEDDHDHNDDHDQSS